jgi:hypothetical protein
MRGCPGCQFVACAAWLDWCTAWRASLGFRAPDVLLPGSRALQAIWLLTTGAREAAFRNVKTIAECLADELINAAKVRGWRRLRLRRGGSHRACAGLGRLTARGQGSIKWGADRGPGRAFAGLLQQLRHQEEGRD